MFFVLVMMSIGNVMFFIFLCRLVVFSVLQFVVQLFLLVCMKVLWIVLNRCGLCLMNVLVNQCGSMVLVSVVMFLVCVFCVCGFYIFGELIFVVVFDSIVCMMCDGQCVVSVVFVSLFIEMLQKCVQLMLMWLSRLIMLFVSCLIVYELVGVLEWLWLCVLQCRMLKCCVSGWICGVYICRLVLSEFEKMSYGVLLCVVWLIW